MPKFLIEWEGNISLNSEDYANLLEKTLLLLEMVKAGMKSHKITDWGAYAPFAYWIHDNRRNSRRDND